MKDIEIYIGQDEMARFIKWCDEHPEQVAMLCDEPYEPTKPRWTVEIYYDRFIY